MTDLEKLADDLAARLQDLRASRLPLNEELRIFARQVQSAARAAGRIEGLEEALKEVDPWPGSVAIRARIQELQEPE
ncbi:MAG: hypothetical protein KIT08_01405 [Anaerolineales bacterium]|nr:MAG: hypothetical protein KIT08_01405 [Anaerolineales bacterium]